MAVSHSIDTATPRVVVTAVGSVGLADAQAALRAVAGDSRFDPSFDLLVDLVKIDWIPTPADMRAIVGLLPHRDQRNAHKIAVVVGNSFHYGMARMASMLAESKNYDINVFLDMLVAAAWLASTDRSLPEPDQLSVR